MEKPFSKRNRQEDRSLKSNDHSLTARETEILVMAAAGYSNERIANELHINSHTVEAHFTNIFKKINVPSRLQAIFWAFKNLK
jgi:DNA-binding CsgD family transcriptional regulator